MRRISERLAWVGPSSDDPAAGPVTRVVVVLATPRSGSTLLCDALDRAGIGHPREFLDGQAMAAFRTRLGVPRATPLAYLGHLRRRLEGNPEWWATQRVTRRSLVRYLDELARLRTSPNGVFSLKVLASQLRVLHRVGLDLDNWGPPQLILLTRRDHVAQAVSTVRANQTRSWKAGEEPIDEPHYDEDRIRLFLGLIEEWDEQVRSYAWGHRWPVVSVEYEDLDRDYAGTVRRVLDSLGDHGSVVPPPGLVRQRDELNDEMIARFRASVTAGRAAERETP